MIATELEAGALSDLAAELRSAGLPISDLDMPGRRFYRFDDAIGLVGYGGIEGTGADRLLRSLVVTPSRRGGALGAAMLAYMEGAAATDGAACLYLLTTTASAFFRRHGYETTGRNDAPAVIAGSAEFQMLCPANADFLSKRIA